MCTNSMLSNLFLFEYYFQNKFDHVFHIAVYIDKTINCEMKATTIVTDSGNMNVIHIATPIVYNTVNTF